MLRARTVPNSHNFLKVFSSISNKRYIILAKYWNRSREPAAAAGSAAATGPETLAGWCVERDQLVAKPSSVANDAGRSATKSIRITPTISINRFDA